LEGGYEMKDYKSILINLIGIFILTIFFACGTLKTARFVIDGDALINKNKYDEAIVEYNKAIAAEPNYAEAYRGRGCAYIRKKEFQKALSDLKKAIEIEPLLPDAQFYLGQAYLGLGQNGPAIKAFTKSIKIEPNAKMCYFYRGIAYCDHGAYDKAIDDLRKINHVSVYNHANYFLGLSYENLEKNKKAVKAYKQFVQRADPKDKYFNHAEKRMKELSKK